jgi:hypothetical protein|tara:strand:- start:1971 stop:2612 length:642 start_codon:yes stop_codon:yes gene_type:complete
MKRRQLLKNLGLGVGAITLTPAVSSLLHSCSDGTSWNPVFFSKSQIKLLSNLTELIIPTDDKIPGAKELNLIKFIDLYILNMMNDKEKRLLKISLDSFIEDCLKENNYSKMEDITESNLESSLKYFYKDQSSMQRSWNTEYNKFSREFDNDKLIPPTKALSYRFLNTIRSLTITSFKWSETIGEKVLAYNPIPGRQVGCVDLQEATGGRAWSP